MFNGSGAGEERDGLTMRNRGTDCVKSPEMLQVSNSQKKARGSYDRRRKEGAGGTGAPKPFYCFADACARSVVSIVISAAQICHEPYTLCPTGAPREACSPWLPARTIITCPASYAHPLKHVPCRWAKQMEAKASH